MSERHIRWLLVALLVGQMVLLTAQVRDPQGKSSYLEAGVMRFVGPVAAAVARIGNGVRGLGGAVRLNQSLQEENRQLREEVRVLREQSIRHFGVEAEVRRLSQALQYKPPEGAPWRPADIVYIDHASWLQTAIIAVDPQGVEVDQPVVVPEGLVGRVVLVAGGYAKVQLITDRSASAGVMIERTRRQGVLRGGGRGNLELDYVPLQADVQVGDLIVTAGIDGIYPRGIPVGTVAAVAPGSELFHRIGVVPRVDFGLLDQVFMLLREAVPQLVQGERPDAQP